MRPVQEVFNAIIESGLFKESEKPMRGSHTKYPAMCLEAHTAYLDGVITAEEKLLVFTETQRYLNRMLDGVMPPYHGPAYLAIVLDLLDMPCHYNDRLKIYQDWENRPKGSKNGGR